MFVNYEGKEVDNEGRQQLIVRTSGVCEGVTNCGDDSRSDGWGGVTQACLRGKLFGIPNSIAAVQELTWSWGKYLEGLVVVSLPRQAAATFRVASSEFSERSNSGTHRASATFSSCPTEQLLTTWKKWAHEHMREK
jgi:hypothetical protein